MVCNGKLSAEYSASLGMKRNRIFIGGNPAESESIRNKCKRIGESERQHMRDKFRLTRPVFLYVGCMIERKGISELLRGWEAYKNQNSNQGSLLLVGDGNKKDSLQRLVKERELQNVCFAGEVDYDDIAKYYACADVFIIPTLEDNWSLVVPEAMACSLPIACSKYNGCWPEMIRNGENGVVFDPCKPEDVVNTLKFFTDRQGVLASMGKLSQSIVKQFTPQRAAEAVLKACELALSSTIRK
jgi:glycosyltransferase involved in cell wall biosynthesis